MSKAFQQIQGYQQSDFYLMLYNYNPYISIVMIVGTSNHDIGVTSHHFPDGNEQAISCIRLLFLNEMNYIPMEKEDPMEKDNIIMFTIGSTEWSMTELLQPITISCFQCWNKDVVVFNAVCYSL